ncbi:hypothetical protein FORC066_3383 [Yersinia enterocolitica]|nr:hypothetical protein FORC065_1168 [Yersinia enterocolitica]UXD30590.1 hypothetical protein FORC066_3383 [Yersinia enterocolitica]
MVDNEKRIANLHVVVKTSPFSASLMSKNGVTHTNIMINQDHTVTEFVL